MEQRQCYGGPATLAQSQAAVGPGHCCGIDAAATCGAVAGCGEAAQPPSSSGQASASPQATDTDCVGCDDAAAQTLLPALAHERARLPLDAPPQRGLPAAPFTSRSSSSALRVKPLPCCGGAHVVDSGAAGAAAVANIHSAGLRWESQVGCAHRGHRANTPL